MEEVFYQYNPWWEETFGLKNVVARDLYLRRLTECVKNKKILFLTGLRRAGKTTLIKLLIDGLLKRKIDPVKIFYVSLDDYFLRDKTILETIDDYRKLHKLKREEKIYVFLDEITYAKDYSQQLKNIYDSQNVKVVASSSSSLLLDDGKSFLTGRSQTVIVNPLDFREYLTFKDVRIKKRDAHLLEPYFRSYMKDGGLPENVLNPSREYLVDLVDSIIQKDITAFFLLKDHRLLKDYFTLLMERSGKRLSLNKIGNILKISPDTSRRYMHYFEMVYLVHLLPRWGSTNERILSPKKIYASDLGIKHLFVGDRDLGSYFENYIYLLLKDKKELYYLYEDAIELDFYTKDKILIESKYNSGLNEKQKRLFEDYPASRKLIIDNVRKLEDLYTI